MSFITVVLYIAAFALWFYCVHREGGIGGGVRFMLAFSLINQFLVAPPLYVLSGLAEIDVDFQNREDAVQLALYSLIGLVFGGYVIAPQIMRRPHLRMEREWKPWKAPDRLEQEWQVAVALFVGGCVAMVGIGPFYAIPTMRAIVSQFGLFLDTGLTLMAVYIMLGGTRQRLSVLLTCLVLSSIFRALTTGFFGNSAMTALYLLAIIIMGRQSSVKSWLYLGVTLYLLLIPYGIWMSVRGGIRESIWRGDSMEQRLLGMNFEPEQGTYLLNPFSPDDLRLIQRRIDQSSLLAYAIQHTPSVQPHAWGYSMGQDILVALVPRVMWPDKPLAAGGSAFVSQYTGLKFSSGVSVGINYLFEFYVNFGALGAVICMTIMSIGCGILDYLWFSRGYRSFKAQWMILLAMWSICVWSDRMAQMAMTVPVAVFNGWLFGRFMETVGWAPVHYDPPAPPPGTSSAKRLQRRQELQVPEKPSSSRR